MLRRWILALALGVGLSAPATAQWLYEEGPQEARAYVLGPGGTSFGFRCTTEAADRQSILIDLLVFPTGNDSDEEDVVEFEIGTWTFNLETLRTGQSGALARYQSRLSFFDTVAENLRRQVKAGSSLRFTRAFDFQLTRFTLSGSRRSVERLEQACGRLWRAGFQPPQPVRPAVPQPPAPPPVASRVPAEALAALQGYVRSVLAPQCAGGAEPFLPPEMFRVSGDRVTIFLGQAQCAWAFGVNPYCGAARCQTWVYGWNGADFTLLENTLR
jgi:hypothetical protein